MSTFEDPKLFREARTMLGISRREAAEAAGEKESSVVDFESGRKKTRPEPAFRRWGGLWKVVSEKKQGFTKDQMERNEPLLDMMHCAHIGLAADISPDKLLSYYRADGELSPEEKQRYDAHNDKELGRAIVPHLTFEQAAQLPWEEVIQRVTREWSPLNLLMMYSKDYDQAKADESFAAQVNNDPRVMFADLRLKLGGAEGWIKRIEKERDDLKDELRAAREERLALHEELIETYRRVIALEKQLKDAGLTPND